MFSATAGAGSGGPRMAEASQACVGVMCAGATCVILQSDSKHCGECGNDCGAGLCTGGVCSPETVESNVADV
jgi:hypothetical protein